MERLDAQAARMLQRAVERKGIEVVLEADTAEISGAHRVEGVTLKDGRTIAADAVVVAIGIRANADLARDAGIAVKRGIVVDDALETSSAGIHAIGECAEHPNLLRPGQARTSGRVCWPTGWPDATSIMRAACWRRI